MKLNHDFYTFSPKHFKKLFCVLEEYPEMGSEMHDFDYDDFMILIIDLAEKGKVQVVTKRGKSRDGGTTHTDFIKFWPNAKHIEYFRQFDKKKLISHGRKLQPYE